MPKSAPAPVTFRLGSAAFVSAPGLVAWAINGAAFPSDVGTVARVIADTWSIPAPAAVALVTGAAPYTVEGETVVFSHAPEVLANGAHVIARRPLPDKGPGTMAAEIVVCFLPDNPATPFATWQRNTRDGGTYWGHYESDLPAAWADYQERGTPARAALGGRLAFASVGA